MNQANPNQPITSLEELQARKELLNEEIQKEDQQIRDLWKSLFHKPTMLTSASPSKRLASMLTTGAGIIDGAILGWKLYKKFKKR